MTGGADDKEERTTRCHLAANMVQRIKKNWFLLGVVCVITWAKLWPWLGAKGGPLKPEVTVKYISVMAIFLTSGMSMRTEDLTQAMMNIKMHLFVQSYTLILVPCLVSLLVESLRLMSLVNPLFLQGLLVVGCMPPPVSSAVILTKAVGGNDAAAVFNSALGSFLGIMVTPILLLYLTRRTGTLSRGVCLQVITKRELVGRHDTNT
ncbi:sodium/bile acid cotransporter 7-A-like [Dysidea avara]|uniref:sodium/bile acid cotransporter 7-A-like n=1 Tax=Dysidea avara TaxID=196820 RepID=UPI00331E3164